MALVARYLIQDLKIFLRRLALALLTDIPCVHNHAPQWLLRSRGSTKGRLGLDLEMSCVCFFDTREGVLSANVEGCMTVRIDSEGLSLTVY